VPVKCTGVPHDELHPADAWGDDEAYGATLTHLARLFVNSFKQYLEVGAGGPCGPAGGGRRAGERGGVPGVWRACVLGEGVGAGHGARLPPLLHRNVQLTRGCPPLNQPQDAHEHVGSDLAERILTGGPSHSELEAAEGRYAPLERAPSAKRNAAPTTKPAAAVAAAVAAAPAGASA
jgi:hypothetical protein